MERVVEFAWPSRCQLAMPSTKTYYDGKEQKGNTETGEDSWLGPLHD